MLDLSKLMKAYVPEGIDLGRDIIHYYDEDHCQKMAVIIEKDVTGYYRVQQACGLNPYDDDEAKFGPGDVEIRIVNTDHFALSRKGEARLDENRAKIYSAIDAEYAKLPK